MCTIKEAIFTTIIQTRYISIIYQLLYVSINPDLLILSFENLKILIPNQRISCIIQISLNTPYTVLHLAVLKGNIELTDILLQYSADIDAEIIYINIYISVRPIVLAALNLNHKVALEFSHLFF